MESWCYITRGGEGGVRTATKPSLHEAVSSLDVVVGENNLTLTSPRNITLDFDKLSIARVGDCCTSFGSSVDNIVDDDVIEYTEGENEGY